MKKRLTHIDSTGRAKMVDVGQKPDTERVAVARGVVKMQPETLQLIIEGSIKKGDVLSVAELAGVMAAKRTSELIPLCHTLALTHVEVNCMPNMKLSRVDIEAKVRTRSKTGVEMEALTAVAVSGLTIYDMTKAVDKSMHVSDVHLISKSGGQSGDFSIES